MDNIKKMTDQLTGQIKTYIDKMDKKTQKIAAASIIGVVLLAVALAFYLNTTGYEVLFAGVEDAEAVQIIARLQDEGIAYEQNANGDILVAKDVADATRATLVVEGYPQSGFNYGIYTQYAGGMTTDSERQQYELYDLQDRLGANIRLIEGVSDAKVTIALQEEEKYVLSPLDDTNDMSSASVTVIMEPNQVLTPEQAQGIQRLVAMGVPGISMENVSVFDGYGIEVSYVEEEVALSDLAEATAKLIEEDVQRKIQNVLSPFFGMENIRVSVYGQINMEKIIRESSTYTVPEQINDQDKSGIVSNESVSSSSSTNTDNSGQVVGTETNADIDGDFNQYTGGDTSESNSVNETAVREYLVNEVREQAQLDPGYLSEMTVSVSINSYVMGDVIPSDLIDLIGNAAGIEAEVREDNISIVAAPFYGYQAEDNTGDVTQTGLLDMITANPLIAIIIGVVLLIIIIVLIVLLTIRKRRKKAAQALAEELQIEQERIAMLDRDALDRAANKSNEVRHSLREFAEQNPEITAQMIKIWLNGGES